MVVGVDFSEGAAVAVGEARRLAARLGKTVTLAYVVENGEDQLESGQADEWLAVNGVASGSVTVLRGVAWVELARHAAESGAGLLVVGSHGQSGFHPMGPGRTATRLSVRSPIPVVVVPAGRPAMAGDVVPETFQSTIRRVSGGSRIRTDQGGEIPW